MADTQRTISALLALLADNTTGEISAQDVRDLVATMRASHGELALTVAGTVSITVQDDWTEVSAGTWALSGYEHEFDSPGSGRLRYTGANPRLLHIACSVSFSLSTGTNDNVGLAIGVNGTVDTRGVAKRFISTAGDVGSTALHLAPLVSQNDYISLFMKNIDSTADLNLEEANLFAMGMPT